MKGALFSNFTVSRKRALGETVKLEKTCCIHIKHLRISIFRTDDTSERSFYETPVDSLDKWIFILHSRLKKKVTAFFKKTAAFKVKDHRVLKNAVVFYFKR